MIKSSCYRTEQLLQDSHQRITQKSRAPWVWVEFRVRDTGIGIPKNQQDFIFTRFCRLHPAYEGQYTGSGLGLALVKQLVDELKGEIRVKSTKGRGSTFSCCLPFTLPRSGSKTKPNCALQEAVYQRTANTLSILIVEDQPLAQHVVKHLLQSLGATVDTANNGAEALAKIQTQRYSLIIMDLGLPDLDGFQITKKIHQWQRQHQQMPSCIAALSAHLSQAERQQCLAMGMIKAYEKPLTLEQAEELLAKAMDVLVKVNGTGRDDDGCPH